MFGNVAMPFMFPQCPPKESQNITMGVDLIYLKQQQTTTLKHAFNLVYFSHHQKSENLEIMLRT